MTLSSKRKNLKHYTGIEVEIAGQYMYFKQSKQNIRVGRDGYSFFAVNIGGRIDRIYYILLDEVDILPVTMNDMTVRLFNNGRLVTDITIVRTNYDRRHLTVRLASTIIGILGCIASRNDIHIEAILHESQEILVRNRKEVPRNNIPWLAQTDGTQTIKYELSSQVHSNDGYSGGMLTFIVSFKYGENDVVCSVMSPDMYRLTNIKMYTGKMFRTNSGIVVANQYGMYTILWLIDGRTEFMNSDGFIIPLISIDDLPTILNNLV